ncbi:MAG: hypothetical protein GY852_00850, partial [bacterium]|nr:hypothetical protein [bacterium]
ASELGVSRLAEILRSMSSFPPAEKLSELMIIAGSTASNARQCWHIHAALPLPDRIIQSAADSVNRASPLSVVSDKPGVLPVVLAVLSWIFFIFSVSGITGGWGW